MSAPKSRDLLVIGGGAGGLASARAGVRRGARTMLVQQGPLGGDCTFTGCVPSKALIEAAGRGVAFGDAMAAGGHIVEADRVLVAVGRTGAVDGLGLEAAGVKVERGFIVTDDTLATTAKGVWAVGDVAGKLQFTHAADEMGRIAVANAFSRGPKHRFRPEWVPWVTFTDPEVAHVGAAEAEVAGRGRVAYVPMTEVDRAVAAGETDGFVKLVAVPRRVLRNAGGGRVVGATIVASRAGELIHEAALAVRTGMFAGRLAQTVHAYPTWSTALRQAAGQLFMDVGGRRARPTRNPET